MAREMDREQERIQANKYRSISIRAEQYLYVWTIISSPISCIALGIVLDLYPSILSLNTGIIVLFKD